nr:hypothetical protein CFP56_62691 [Quercus suber]
MCSSTRPLTSAAFRIITPEAQLIRLPYLTALALETVAIREHSPTSHQRPGPRFHARSNVSFLRTQPHMWAHQDRPCRLLQKWRFWPETVRWRRDCSDRANRNGVRNLPQCARIFESPSEEGRGEEGCSAMRS